MFVWLDKSFDSAKLVKDENCNRICDVQLQFEEEGALLSIVHGFVPNSPNVV